MKRATPSRGGIGVLVAGALLVLPLGAHARPVSDWPMGGRDPSNTRHQPNETAIGPETVYSKLGQGKANDKLFAFALP